MRRRGCRPAASHPDARPVSPADEIRRIAPLLDALSDQMHRVSIDSFQPETQRYALKRGVGYLNDIQGFPDPALYPDIAEADCRLVVMHSAQRDGIATRTGHLRPEDALDEIVRFFEARFPPCDGAGRCRPAHPRSGMGFFLSPAPETSLHVLSNLQKLKSALGFRYWSRCRGNPSWAPPLPSCKGSGSSEPCGGTSRDRQWR
ncbi:hypothetical protein FXN60_28715 (plasmid) [Klebsiella pneumoniae]|nr:hypothetical protein FXN60_28715 [Klebsiella pneumoniae]